MAGNFKRRLARPWDKGNNKRSEQILSRNENFTVKVIGDGMLLKILPSIESNYDGTIIGVQGMDFEITYKCTKEELSHETFAVKLLLDNQEVIGGKRFNDKGFIEGFPCADRQIEKFRFNIPELGEMKESS